MGATFNSQAFALSAAEIEGFHAQFDPAPPQSSERGHAHEWLATCLATRVISEVFWWPSENVGGTGLDFVRWPHPLQAGDRLRGEIKILESRALRTRPGLGLVRAQNICANQRGEVVSSSLTTVFFRMRSAR